MFDDVTEVATFDIVMPQDLSITTLLEVCDFDHVDLKLIEISSSAPVCRGCKLTIYLYPIKGNVLQDELFSELLKRGLRALETPESLTLLARFPLLPRQGTAIILSSLYVPPQPHDKHAVACVKRAKSNGERWLVKEFVASSPELDFFIPLTNNRQ